MSEALHAKRRRTWRTWLLRAFLLFAVVTAFGAVSTWWGLSSEYAAGLKERDAVVAELDETDPGWRWNEIAAGRDPIPDDQNAARIVKKVTEALDDSKVESLKWSDGRPLVPPKAAANRRLDETTLAHLREELAACEPAVALAVRLKDYPRGRTAVAPAVNPLDTLLPHVPQARLVAHVLRLDVERLLHAGRFGDVPDRVRATLHAGASLRDESFLICALVRIAIRLTAVNEVERVLAMSEVPDNACQRLMTDLEAELHENLLLTALRGERAANHCLFENLEAGRLTFERVMEHKPSAIDPVWWLSSRIYAARRPDDHACLLRRFSDLCDIARRPAAEWPEAFAEFEEDGKASRAEGRRILAHLMMPAAVKIARAALRDRTAMTCAHAGLAAERYRLAHKRWPAELTDLVPAYLPEVPTDPYTSEPIVLARHPDGIVLYSVGADGEDDGGAVDAPETGLPADFGVRLYDPARRGLPAGVD